MVATAALLCAFLAWLVPHSAHPAPSWRYVLCAVKRSADAALATDAPDTLTNHDNENVHFQLAGGGCVPSSALAAHACAYREGPHPMRLRVGALMANIAW